MTLNGEAEVLARWSLRLTEAFWHEPGALYHGVESANKRFGGVFKRNGLAARGAAATEGGGARERDERVGLAFGRRFVEVC